MERCFEDQKTEVGFDHFEGRSYVGLMRHQRITALTHLFLSRVHQEWRGEKSGIDGLPGSHGDIGDRKIVMVDEPNEQKAGGSDGGDSEQNSSPQRAITNQPSQKDVAKTARHGHHDKQPTKMRMEGQLAL